MSTHVVVLGGGVIGTACAWMLARAGARVTLLERGRIGGEASGAAAGILAPFAEAGTPGAFVRLGLAGLRAFVEELPDLRAESGIDPDYVRRGVLRMAFTAAEQRRLQDALAWQSREPDCPVWLEPADLTAMEPRLAPSLGALWSPNEAQVRPPELVQALATAAARRGAALRESQEVHAIEPGAGGVRLQTVQGDIAADAVLIAGGAWADRFLMPFGLPPRLRPVKGQYALLRPDTPLLSRVVFAGHAYLVPRSDGTIYAGATQEEAGEDRRVTSAGLQDVLAGARMILPGTADAEVIGHGAGLRPGSADGLPVLGTVPDAPGVYVAAGHFRNGVLLCLITARLMTDLILRGQESALLESFRPGR